MHNVKVVFENVQIAKNERGNLHYSHYGKYNVILLYKGGFVGKC